jgi:hypothetical protein
VYRLRFTADVYTYDEPCDTPDECQCTNVYGEYTEHGYGMTESSGYIDPRWSSEQVEDEPTHYGPTPDEVAEYITAEVLNDNGFDTDGRKTQDQMIWSDICYYIGPVDYNSGGYPVDEPEDWLRNEFEDGETYYQDGTQTLDYRTGTEARYAVHVERW